MKKYFQNSGSILAYTVVILIAVFYLNDNKKLKKSYNVIAHYKDSLNLITYSDDYKRNLIEINHRVYNPLSDSCKGFELTDSKMALSMRLTSIFKISKKTMIVRYSSIGCNSCSDSSLKILKEYPVIRKNYNILVLVDFNNYEYLIKWKKISDVEDKILFVKKGELPYKSEQEEKSYIFIIDSTLVGRSFFVPNSYYVNNIRNYFSEISQAY